MGEQELEVPILAHLGSLPFNEAFKNGVARPDARPPPLHAAVPRHL